MNKYPFIIRIFNPTAFSGQGSTIEIELPDGDAAKRLAYKLAEETGRRVTIRDPTMKVIETVEAAKRH